MSGPEDNPRDDELPTKEEWDAYEASREMTAPTPQQPIEHIHTNSCYSRKPETEDKGGYLSCGLVAGKQPQRGIYT